MNATTIAMGVLDIVLIIGLGVCALYAISCAINRVLLLFFEPFARARRADYTYRVNRAAVESRMPYRPGSVEIMAKNDEAVADALIELTKTRAR